MNRAHARPAAQVAHWAAHKVACKPATGAETTAPSRYASACSSRGGDMQCASRSYQRTALAGRLPYGAVCRLQGADLLLQACQTGDRSLVQTLIFGKADANMVDQSGCTALMWASYGGHTEGVQTLISSKAEVNKTDRAGVTALRLASHQSRRHGSGASPDLQQGRS